jgi:hypothetical protein
MEKEDSSSVESGLESGSEISPEESTIIEAEVSQLKTQRRSEPSMPLVEATLSIFNFFHSRILI